MDFLWVALAVAGIVLLSPFADVRQALDPVGVVLALAAGGCWALYIVFAQKAGAELGGRTVAYGMAIAAVLSLPFGLAGAAPALGNPSILLSAAVMGFLFLRENLTALQCLGIAAVIAAAFGAAVTAKPPVPSPQ
ncbi:hypothetical protein [Mesorhizobium sp. LjNodule214]|uniref:hypothetical protein n=1 Tax=Mesorhizobium sp. LjNodule214 TaxID=3342252 RepID=UPI003F4F8904